VTDLERLLQTAVEATTRARELILRRGVGSLTAKGDRDFTSETDYEVERDLRTFLADATPSIGFLGEEGGASGAAGALQWILDPIDGTVNFARGLPLCGVSLALVEAGRPVLGVIELPFLSCRYEAVHGSGAYRNGTPIRASSVAHLRDAVVAIGDYAVGENADERNAPRLALTALLARNALRVRMLGSAAVDLAWVADGKVDAAVMLSNNPWDTAAGAIIAREAGAAVVDLDGSDHTARSRGTVAVAPDLLQEILELVNSAAGGSVA
jgi:myo-inositol-1(or 4)-monophosphatase